MSDLRLPAWMAICVLACVLSFSLAEATRADSRNSFPIAIQSVTVIQADGTTLENATVVVRDGRIVEVGTDVTPPPQAEVIDASGMFAYPGFVSAHSYLGIAETKRTEEARQRTEDENPDVRQRSLPRTRAANRRGVQPQFRAADHFNADDTALDGYRAFGFTTGLISPRGGVFGGTSALINLSDAPLRRKVLAGDVAQHSSFKTWEPGNYPRSVLGVFAVFRQTLLDARWSIEQQRHFERNPHDGSRPPVDPALVALQPVLEKSRPIIFEANDDHEIRRAIKLAQEFDLHITISGGKEAYKAIDVLKRTHTPVIVSLNFDEEPEYGKKTKAAGGKKKAKTDDPNSDEPPADEESEEAEKEDDENAVFEPLKLRKERRRLWEEQVANSIRLHEAGVAFSFATHDVASPKEFLKNLRLVVDRGLPVSAAVAALTSAPAELFGSQNQIGHIRAGLVANLAIFNGPMQDKESKLRYVLIDGEKHEYNRDAKSPEAEAGSEDNDASESTDQDDRGPTWRCEIDADRVPKLKTGGDVLIRNATVIPIVGETMRNASVLIEGGKIKAIGRSVSAPDGVAVIDATGLFVMPGIVDCHSHMAIDGVNEGTLSVTAEVRVGDVVRNDSVSMFRALAGGATTTHAMHGSANPIGGQNVVFKLKYKRPVDEMIVQDAPRTIKWALGENVKQSNRASAHGKRFPNGRMGVEAVLRDALVAAEEYDRTWETYRANATAGRETLIPRRDMRLEALSSVLAGDIWVHAHCYRSDEIIRMMHMAEDFGIRIAVLQHVLEGYRIAPEIRRHGASASSFANDWAYKLEAYGALPHNVAMMTAKDIICSVNSDSANTIRYLNTEAAKCIKWGNMDENAALRMITINPAIQLGIDHRLGSIEKGKDGDLAIFNGHPLNAHAKSVMTLIEGEVYFQDEHAQANFETGPLEWNPKFDMTIPQSTQRLYAITGATVHPISGDAIPNGTVVIRNGTIEAVGASVSVPPGAGVIDARGLHVYPGLIDGSGTLGLTEIGSLRASRDNFDIAEFAPELKSLSAIHPHSAHIRIARAAGVTAQLARPTGGTVSGQSALINLDGWTADEMLIEESVGLHMSVPSLPDQLAKKDKTTRTEKYEKRMREIDTFFERARQYAAAVDAGRDDPTVAPTRDLRLEAMRPFVRGESPVIFSASGYKHILNTIEFAEKHNLKPIIRGGTQAWKLADRLAEKDIPVILERVTSYPSGRFEAWDSIYTCAAALDSAGVRWCFATGSASNAYDLSSEAGMAVAHGLPPERAVFALTLGAADVLGVADRLGSIEPGKQADLIVTTHAPSQTICRVSHMFMRGVPVELTNMHTESYDKFNNRPAPELPPRATLKGPSYYK